MGTLEEDMITITHGSVCKGPAFFSCCSVRLGFILAHIIDYEKLPKVVDSKNTFTMYKPDDKDITFKYFENYDNFDDIVFDKKTIDIYKKILYVKNFWNTQFSAYKLIDFNLVW